MRQFNRVLLFPLLVAAGFPVAGGATTLTFDQARDAATQSIVVPTSSGAVTPEGYGDRVSGSPSSVPGGQFTYGESGEGFTPNVVVDYLAASDTRLWIDGYGDLINVLFARVPISGGGIPDTLGILLTADPGFEVQLYHFDLAGWNKADYIINGVTVSDGSSNLFAQDGVLVEGNSAGPPHTGFDFGLPLSAASLLIEIDFGNIPGSMRDNIGIDNIRFGQAPPPSAIPLPGGILLFGSGLLGLAGLSRLRRQAR